MRNFSLVSIVSAVAAAASLTTAATTTNDPFHATAVCDARPKVIGCKSSYARLDFGVAIYGQTKNGTDCLRAYEKPPKKTCLKNMLTKIRQRCNGKRMCMLSTKNMPNQCKTRGSNVLHLVYVCRDQRSQPKHRLRSLLSKLKKNSKSYKKIINLLKLRRKTFRRRAALKLIQHLKYRRLDSVQKNCDNIEKITDKNTPISLVADDDGKGLDENERETEAEIDTEELTDDDIEDEIMKDLDEQKKSKEQNDKEEVRGDQGAPTVDTTKLDDSDDDPDASPATNESHDGASNVNIDFRPDSDAARGNHNHTFNFFNTTGNININNQFY